MIIYYLTLVDGCRLIDKYLESFLSSGKEVKAYLKLPKGFLNFPK